MIPSLAKRGRNILRVGGAGLLGLSLGSMLELQAVSARAADVTGGKTGGTPGWGKAKSIIMVYLPGRAVAPGSVGSEGKRSRTNPQPFQERSAAKSPASNFTEILPKLAQVNDKLTMIRSMSYTPNGLFNHTAAIYQR